MAKYGYDENLTAPILDREHSYELEDKIETVELWYK